MVALTQPNCAYGYFVRYREKMSVRRRGRGRRVYVGPFLDRAEASRAKRKIKAWDYADKVRVVVRRANQPIRLRKPAY